MTNASISSSKIFQPMNTYLDKLQPYPFEKLKALFSGHTPEPTLTGINLSIGEPKAPTPELIKQAVYDNLNTLANYPITKGNPELRHTLVSWATARFNLPSGSLDPELNVLPVNGTREALFAIAQTCIDSSDKPKVVIPNPFYQIYEGAALLAGAEPIYVNLSVIDGDIPGLNEISESTWNQVQLLYICTPANPTGEVIPLAALRKLIDLAHQYDFIVVSDECYSEIYFDENNPPQGILRAAIENGDASFSRCLAFFSLSKRSNAPGLRSGFVAGDGAIVRQYLKYRTYHGCAMPISTQHASIAAWSEEEHVKNNRERYRESFSSVLHVLSETLSLPWPDATFYLWLPTPIDDEEFAVGLYCEQNIVVLPGKYLAREVNNLNPGTNRVRIALVASPSECAEAARRINQYLKKIN